MKISVENLGTIKKGEISLDKDLTIFTGENNSGKSYMMYFNYGILEALFSVDKSIDSSFRIILEVPVYRKELSNGISVDIKQILSLYFVIFIEAISAKKNGIAEVIFNHKMDNLKFEIKDVENLILKASYEYFKKLEGAKLSIYAKNYTISVDNEFITLLTDEYNLEDAKKSFSLLMVECINKLKKYFVPAERTAINMFYSDIVKQKALENEELTRQINITIETINEMQQQGKLRSRSTKPINDYIYFCYDFRNHVLNPLTEFADLATELENLLGGGVGVSGFGDLQFQPNQQENQIPLHLSSSLVKSWSGVVIYLRHLAQKNDILMIDEPEINLHPKSQVLIARFLAKMVNRGIRIVVSTHSDYILRELSTLIILNKDFEGKIDLLQRYGYEENNTLAGDKVGVYHFGNQTITNIPITNKGIETDSIDEVISRQNEISDMVYYSYLDTLPEEE